MCQGERIGIGPVRVRLPGRAVTAQYDLFFSYRRADLGRAEALLRALEDRGLRVWRDLTHLGDFDPITDKIRGALAASKALLAFFSKSYPDSRACQQELTAAWIAALHLGDHPYNRVLVVNPESDLTHIPRMLRDQQQHLGWAGDAGKAMALAESIAGQVGQLQGALAPTGLPQLPLCYGFTPVEAPYFVGRARELWELHGQLTANRMSIVTGTAGQAVVQLRGLGGIGKSLLAREYAIRFGPAWPGGVFWLNAYGHDDTKGALDAGSREALRLDQVRAFAERMGICTDGLKPEEVQGALSRRLKEQGQPCLWIVDDLPSGLDSNAIERWAAPWAGAATLITTRSTEYGALGQHVDLDVLEEQDACRLLTARRAPKGPAEEQAVREIAGELGRHPLAIEIAAAFLAKGTMNFTDYLGELRRDDQDAVEYGASLREALPTGHERSIAATLLKSIRQLGPEGADLLRLAAALAVEPIPVSLMREVFEEAGVHQATAALTGALDQADSLSLCQKAADDARLVHTLVSRTVRRYWRDPARAEGLRQAAVRALIRRLEGKVEDPDGRRRVAREVAHAQHLVSGGLANAELATLGLWIARYHYSSGDFRSARALEEQVLEARRRLLGPEHPDTLTAMVNLASTLWAQGELGAARALKEQVLEACRRLLGPEHPDTTIAAWNYWLTLRAAGEQEAAARVFEECLRWLVERDAATLGVDQRKIRVMVADALRTFRG